MNLEKSELEPKQDFDFVGYQFDLRSDWVRLTPDRWQNLQEKMLKLLLPGPGIHVLDRFTNSYRKASSSRSTSYETHSTKGLTFKTVFLLALGSGKCRSETHAWQNRNIRHQSDWSNVSLYPSPSFLSKNQLAKEGPDSVAPGVITALAPTLDRSLKSDRSLCPVRALRFHLDRTSDLRQNKEVVFVSFKTSHLPQSPLGSSRLRSYVTSSLARRPTLYIRLKPMMSGPLLLLRSSSRESP